MKFRVLREQEKTRNCFMRHTDKIPKQKLTKEAKRISLGLVFHVAVLGLTSCPKKLLPLSKVEQIGPRS